VDQDRAPYFDALKSYVEQRNLTFHVPGHQHGLSVPPEFAELLHAWGLSGDITEVLGIDDIHDPSQQCLQAQQLAAELYGADHTFFLVNGSTVGNQAMFLSTLGPEATVILPHNSHRSVHSALLLSGAKAHFFATDFHPELLCSLPPTVAQAVQAMDRFPDAQALFLTSPTYHGACAPIRTIVEEAHKRDMLVLVDEAWGSHLRFCQGLMSAVEAGADMVVQSSHKLTSAMTQGALLHVNGLTTARVQSVLRHLQTSSPSSLIVASLDCARRQMALAGTELWREAWELALHLQRSIDELEGVSCFSTPRDWDRSRLIVQAVERGYSGYDLESALRHGHDIQVEMSEAHQVTLLVTPGHTAEHGERLVSALKELPMKDAFPWDDIRETFLSLWTKNSVFETPEMTVRETFFSPQSSVSLEKAVDQTCAELLYCYPPGVPFVYPGQRFSREALELIETGRRLGCSAKGGVDPNLDSVLILDNEI
jgi:arginine decarboxylase